MGLKVPKICPWCGKPYVELSGQEQTALRGIIQYACGTSISLYDSYVQVTSPDAHRDKSGWWRYDIFQEMIHGQV